MTTTVRPSAELMAATRNPLTPAMRDTFLRIVAGGPTFPAGDRDTYRATMKTIAALRRRGLLAEHMAARPSAAGLELVELIELIETGAQEAHAAGRRLGPAFRSDGLGIGRDRAGGLDVYHVALELLQHAGAIRGYHLDAGGRAGELQSTPPPGGFEVTVRHAWWLEYAR